MRVDVDAVAAPLERHRARHVHHRGLAHAVDADLAQHAQAGHRRDVDDAPAGEGARRRAAWRARSCAWPLPARRRRRRACWCPSRSRSPRASRRVSFCVVLTPELLTRMSIVPISVSACATAALMLSWSVTSSATTCASPPSASISARSVFRRSMRRAASTTPAPALAQRAGELRAQAARRAGDQGHAARQIDVVAHALAPPDGVHGMRAVHDSTQPACRSSRLQRAAPTAAICESAALVESPPNAHSQGRRMTPAGNPRPARPARIDGVRRGRRRRRPRRAWPRRSA